ncbi:integration host factor subunit alpha [Geothermobacter ehrlichii]|uniref:Integration host factor subunit alpha n=1 Tax=Geothermobacter ehrlichii TaxID=213224 RepID=A0A5D3WHU0_9BACT|nr:integration host factor subunit alpha [Geothermobacter ehrlichii]TYO96799.1 integration host factor subunit alpha [Geothermobacter ehrlichii]
MTKADIVENVSTRAGLTQKDAAEAVEEVLELIKSTLTQGEDVKITGFGKFQVRNKQSRVGRNPHTGEQIEISARRVLVFKPSPSLKELLNK